MPYLYRYLFGIILLLIFIFDTKAKRNNPSKYFKQFYILLALLVAVRYGVGADTCSYMVAFEEIPPINEITTLDLIRFRFQPLYTIINSIAKYIYNDFVTVQILQSVLFYHSLYILIKKLKLYRYYILFFFYTYTYFSAGMTTMRESFALAMCMYAFNFYLEKRWIFFYILSIIGFLFHTGAIINFIIPIFSFFTNPNKRKVYFFALITTIFIANILIQNIQGLIGAFTSDGSITRYSIEDNNSFSWLNIIRNVIILFILYWKAIYPPKRTYRIDIILLGIVYVLIDVCSSTVSPILFRLNVYFFIFFCCCIQEIIYQINKKYLFQLSLSLFFIYYQPFTRGINLLFVDPHLKETTIYCSIFDSNKSHYTKILNETTADDYILF